MSGCRSELETAPDQVSISLDKTVPLTGCEAFIRVNCSEGS